MPPLVKGPMTVTGFIAFAQGWGGLYIRANKLWTEVGSPAAYDYGQIRHLNVVGDWILIDGMVLSKEIDADGDTLVTVEQVAKNQYGETSALGTGTVQLPRRPS